MCGRIRVIPCSCICTFLARAVLTQKFPRVNPMLVAIVPVEADGILAHRRRLHGLRSRLEHRQLARLGYGLSRFAYLAAALAALLIAERAGTSVPQPREAVAAQVAVFPGDLHAGAGSEIHLYRLRICQACTRRHDFSIA